MFSAPGTSVEIWAKRRAPLLTVVWSVVRRFVAMELATVKLVLIFPKRWMAEPAK